jgi:hypothetical protein
MFYCFSACPHDEFGNSTRFSPYSVATHYGPVVQLFLDANCQAPSRRSHRQRRWPQVISTGVRTCRVWGQRQTPRYVSQPVNDANIVTAENLEIAPCQVLLPISSVAQLLMSIPDAVGAPGLYAMLRSALLVVCWRSLIKSFDSY